MEETTLLEKDISQPEEMPKTPATTLPVKYNKQLRELSMEEATTYAQKGMKLESLEPMLDKLKMAAASTGVTVSDLVDGLTVPAATPVDVNQRLADEFCQLQKECPEITDFGQLPKPVVEMAAEGMHMFDAYLRFRYQEEQRAQAAITAQTAAAQASAGSLSTPAHNPNQATETFINAFWKSAQ